MKPHLLLGLCVCAGLLPAQNVATFPSTHATIANGSSSIYWFPYSYGVSRHMAVYESWDLTIPNGRSITRIGFRQDGSTASTGYSLQLEVRMGRTLRTAADLAADYDSNYQGSPTTVFGPALYALPTLTAQTSGAMLWLDLTTPFVHDSSRNLLVEWRVYANSNGSAPFNYYLDSATFSSPVVAGPAGCPHSGNQTPTLTSQPSRVGGTWSCYLGTAPASQLAVWLVNFGPLVSPYPIPWIAGIQSSCLGQINLNGPIQITAVTNGGGQSYFSVPIPNNRIYNNMILSSQAACFDFFAPGGVVVSNGDQMQIGINPPTAMIYNQGSATQTTGSVVHNGVYNAVTFFDYTN